MNWSDLGRTVADFAPVLGRLLGGPAAAGIGKIIANEFGTKEDPEEVMKAIKSDPDAAVKLKKIELQELQSTADVHKSMLLSEAKSKHTTRPKIALGCFKVLAFTVLVTISIFAYSVIVGDDTMTTAVVNGWPFIGAVVAPLVALLYAYFGILRKEDKDRLDAYSGVSHGGVLGEIFKKIAK